jgi:hypothetical protein
MNRCGLWRLAQRGTSAVANHDCAFDFCLAMFVERKNSTKAGLGMTHPQLRIPKNEGDG